MAKRDGNGGGKPPVKVDQPHGGALQQGNPGNHGGPGAPPSALRAAARQSWFDRLAILEAIIDGEPLERTRVELATLLPYVECPRCSERMVKRDGVDASVEVEAFVTPRAGDRIKGMSELSKVALSPGITADDVRERLGNMLRFLERELGREQFAKVAKGIRVCWTA